MRQGKNLEDFLISHKDQLNAIIRQYPFYRQLEDAIKKYYEGGK